MPPASVQVPRHVLEGLAAAARHKEVQVDPVLKIRAGFFPTDGGQRTVSYRCAPDCPVCAAHALLKAGD